MAFGIKKRDKAPAKKKKAKGKLFRPSKGSKFVLFIGDEGAILVHLKGALVQSRQYIPDASPQHLDELRQTLLKDPDAYLSMVVDSMDQSYVQQTLPPVSKMSVGKLMKRRLDRDFGANDIKGAVLLGRESSGRKDWNFLMISLERSPQFTVWLNFISELPHRFLGIYLVPVETELLVKHLEAALKLDREKEAEWKFFVSHNKVGGFRQVILRNGRIIFTRLAQPIGESNTEVIAGNIEQEMLNTIEYMKRLAFNPQAGLDIYIVASNGIRDAIDSSKFLASSLTVLTPYELAQHFSIEGATQPTDQFGDVVLASIIGSSPKHILTLNTPEFERLESYYRLLHYQRAGAALGGIGLVAYAAYLGYGMIELNSRNEEFNQKKNQQQQQLDSLKAEITKSNLDVEKADDLLSLYMQMVKEKISPLPLVVRIKPVVQQPVAVKGLEWVLGEGRAERNVPAIPPPAGAMPPGAMQIPGGPGGVPRERMNVTVTLEFPPAANDPKVFRAISKKVMADFKAAFDASYDISYGNLPVAAADTGRLEIDFSETKPEEIKDTAIPAKGTEAQLYIKGYVISAEDLVTPVSPTNPILSTP